MTASNWPGLAMEVTSSNDIFYADVPKDVLSLLFDNTVCAWFFNDDSLKGFEQFTTDVPACGYEAGESKLYPDGIDSFDNMIFVIEPYTPSIIPLSENALKECHGEWYYYYGSGCYGTEKDGIKTYDCIRDDHNHTQKSAKDIIAEYEAKTGEKVETNRYYFLMPNGSNGKKGADGYAENWYNKYSKGASISWWDSKSVDSSNYPGNTMEHDKAADVYFADVPKDVTMISINNSLNRGYDKEALIHSLAKQIDPVPCEYYDPGENELYPEGIDSFDNMIYVIDPDRYSERSSSKFYEGEWYYYYGDGCYGTAKDGNIDNCIRDDHDHPQLLYKDKLDAFIGNFDINHYNETYYHSDENGEIDWALIDVTTIPADPIIGRILFCDVVIEADCAYTPFIVNYTLYDAKTDEFYRLDKIDASKYDNLEEVVKTKAKYHIRVVGDADGDGELSIMDATFIQMAIAGLCDFLPDDYFGDYNVLPINYLSDIDRDGDRSIMDATAIQLKLAGLE